MTHSHSNPHPIIPGPVSDFVAEVALAPRQAWKGLSLWPLVLPEGATDRVGPPYVTLGEALASGSARIEEVTEGGSVPLVGVANRGDSAVLFLFGEEITGALQNRVANASFLVPARSELVVDVSCVEAGRWSRRSAQFGASREVMSSAVRRKMARRVAQARAASGGSGRFRADQQEVWEEIEQRISATGAPSPTRAYCDYRESRSHDLDEVSRAFRPLERQVGFVAAIGDRVTGAEAIGSPRVFAESFRALLRAYAIDAVDASLVKESEEPPLAEARHFDAPEPFLDALARAPFLTGTSLGAGEDLRIEGPAVSGCALAHHGLVHLTAFPAQD